MHYTELEYLEICREMYDFLLKYTVRYKTDHPDVPYSVILKDHSLLAFLMRNTSSENFDFPEEVLSFLEDADIDFARAGEKYRTIIPELASKNVEGAFSQNKKFDLGMSVRWDPPRSDVPSNWCVFHMWNALKPKSFLSEPEYFASNFMLIMQESQQLYPQFDTLFTGSWLLSEPRFQKFFPEEWIQNMSEPAQEFYWDQGSQGQFINARGSLNRRNAAFFLETGKLPYPPRRSHCSYENMRQHLLENFLKGEI